MKDAIYKIFAAAFTVVFFWGTLHAMNVLGNLNDYNYAVKAAEKNSGLAAAGYDIPAVSDGYAEKMRTEPAPVTDEELSHIYIDGIRFDFPIILADIREHFETRKFTAGYDEDNAEYTGAEILMKNGVGTYLISYTSDVRRPSPEKCIVRYIRHLGSRYSEKYYPRVTAAGIDVFRTPQEEILRLAALDGNEYLAKNAIISRLDDGYAVLDPDRQTISYYRKNDSDDMAAMENITPLLIAAELRLPENYSAETVTSKEELKEYALEYAFSVSDEKYRKNIEETVTELYSTAYEFLANDPDEYNAMYYELTDIESLQARDLTDNDKDIYYYDESYLKVTAYCYIEENGYERTAKTEMLLKAGDPLGGALIIYIDL